MANRNILLTGFFGHRNLGDDLLLRQAFEKIPPQYRLFILWPCGAEEEAKAFGRIRPFTPVYGWKQALCRRYAMFIYAGGGLFPSRQFTWKQCVRGLLTGLTARRKVLNGVGIVPKTDRRWFDLFLRTFDYCSVRDELSRKFLLPIQPAAVNCGDLYWGADQPAHISRMGGGGKD